MYVRPPIHHTSHFHFNSMTTEVFRSIAQLSTLQNSTTMLDCKDIPLSIIQTYCYNLGPPHLSPDLLFFITEIGRLYTIHYISEQCSAKTLFFSLICEGGDRGVSLWDDSLCLRGCQNKNMYEKSTVSHLPTLLISLFLKYTFIA